LGALETGNEAEGEEKAASFSPFVTLPYAIAATVQTERFHYRQFYACSFDYSSPFPEAAKKIIKRTEKTTHP